LHLDESKFASEYFLYLGGNANSLTREFLADKSVEFFIDYDIVSMNFYEHIAVKSKHLYVPDDIEELFARYGNQTLYQKQRKLLKSNYGEDTVRIVSLITRHKKVLEQEIV
jgi:hypothetical protein